jgi:hypothetical protein
MGNGAGDKLARGMAKAQFPSSSGVSDKKWSDAFADFDPAAYKATEDAKDAAKEQRLRDADAEEAGIPSTQSRKA